MKNMLLGILAISLIIGTVYCKANAVRECEVIGTWNNLISVLHPNGNLYNLYVDEDDIGRFHKGEIVDVVFDEMYEWDIKYVAKDIK